MSKEMDEATFLNFYKNTALNYSVAMKKAISRRLMQEKLITFDPQTTLENQQDYPLFLSDKDNTEATIAKTTTDARLSQFYEKWELIKLYKYSVPFFFESDKSVEELLEVAKVHKLESQISRTLPAELKDAQPIYYKVSNQAILVKFVLQKSYPDRDTYESVDYRYPVVIYFDLENKCLEIRYDAVKNRSFYPNTGDIYSDVVSYSIKWLKDVLKIRLFKCDHSQAIDKLKTATSDSVKIYRQMMLLNSGGSADLTAAMDEDSVLPFIGELRELIDENEEVFNKAPEIKELLIRYLDDKETTANYPYVYVQWENPVVSQSYLVKITFDFSNREYTVLQHLTGTCKDLEMGRMNDAIKYLCTSGTFIKGEEL
ncbi:hypothetical protein [Lactobacillus delbrueckii]|uniref:hypothetical protein n=1 Tax=Lactobacillus delbrueckii TaxID=1584 RepID=UPI0039952661